MKKYLFLSLSLLIVLFSISQPVINSFSPLTAAAGAVVTISGTGFSSNISGNVVYFGASKAVINTASAGTLTVTVPNGATYAPITVTVNNLTGYSRQPFIFTFTGGGIFYKSFTYGYALDSVPSNNVTDIAQADFDNDGKTDIVVIETGINVASVYRNTTVNRYISFGAKLNLTIGQQPSAVVTGDVDGDGKQDIIVANSSTSSLSVLRNTSTIGSVSFAPKVDIATGSPSIDLIIADLDGDGKPDLAALNSQSGGSLSILRNTGSPGNISFAGYTSIMVGNGLGSLANGDFDNDGRPDLVISSITLNAIGILKNTSSAGIISFVAQPYMATGGSYTNKLAVGDLNADGKSEIVAADYLDGTLFVFKNTTTPGSISFAAHTDYLCGGNAQDVVINDLDGDSHPDIAVMIPFTAITVLKNTGTGGSILFNPYISYHSGTTSTGLSIADIDGDGKSDISGIAGSQRAVIFINRCNEPQITSFNPMAAGQGANVTISGENFTGATAVSFGGVAATSFTVNSATSISAIVGIGTSGDISVTNQYGTGAINNFIFAAPPVVTSFTPVSAGYNSFITITGKNFTSVYNVKLGGTNLNSVTIVTPTTITGYVDSGTSGSVSVTTAYGTGSLAGFTYLPLPQVYSFAPVTGGTGTVVTITGRDFTGATSVTFGGIPAAAFLVVNSYTINATVGTNGATGNIKVTTPLGSGVSADVFKYVPPPVISSFAPAIGGTGDTITIKGKYFAGATNVSFGSGIVYASMVSDTIIRAILNNNCSGGSVSVTTPGGIDSLSGFVFYHIPVLSSFSPHKGGNGSIITLTGMDFTGATGVSFGGVPVTSFTVLSSTTISAVLSSMALSDTIKVTTPGGIATIDKFKFITVPVIASFAPLSGPIGTAVTISGANFSPVAANNTVYFGAVRANVVSATANNLVVTVPAGASFKPVTVATNQLLASSAQSFDVTFAGGGITQSTFPGRTDFNTGNNASSLATGDFDNDGKPDVVVTNYLDSTISIYKNNSSSSAISFLPKINLFSGNAPHGAYVYDVDGDGKPDIVILNYFAMNSAGGPNHDFVTIFKNTSSNGVISFSSRYTFETAFTPIGVALHDLDDDGKPEMVVAIEGEAYNGYSYVCLFKNTSSGGIISFNPYQRVNTQIYTPGSNLIGHTSIAFGDVNADDKVDIVVGSSDVYFTVLINDSYPNFLNFGHITFNNGLSGGDLEVMCFDFDGDNKPDVITNELVLHNGTYFNNVDFQSGIRLFSQSHHIAAGDIDGDGKPDLVTAETYPAVRLDLRKNTNGGVGPDVYVPNSGTNVSGILLVDLDGDGRPELCTSNTTANNFSVYKNTSQALPLQLISFTAFLLNKEVRLKWQTAHEQNTSQFNVERSADEKTFTGIGQLAAAGFSAGTRDYILIDKKPLKGLNYYRLKMIDKDGKFIYSPARLINYNNTYSITVYPNPATNTLNLVMPSTVLRQVQLLITDIAGKTIQQQVLQLQNGDNIKVINISELNKGTYIIKIISSPDNKTIETAVSRFVKE